MSSNTKKKSMSKNINPSNEKTKHSKKDKKNLYTEFKNGITERSSEDEEEKETSPIKIYYKEKIATLYMNINEPFSKLIDLIKEKFKIENFEKKFEIFYNQKEIPLTDGRIMLEIVGNEEEKEEDAIFELREKFIKNIGYKDKLYIELENIPSYMDLTMQITYFISQQKKVVDYELNYINNKYKLLFSSNQIGFSFISFMTNLKFTNKYYRKLKIDIHYKTIDKISYNNEDEKKDGNDNNKEDKNKSKSKNRRNAILSPIPKRKGLKLFNKFNNKKSKSYKHLYINNSNESYFLNKNNFINDSIPYEQEKLIKKIENARNKRKWMNLKGFFTSANKQTFNSLISPNLKIHKIKISNNNGKKCKKLSLINMSSD